MNKFSILFIFCLVYSLGSSQKKDSLFVDKHVIHPNCANLIKEEQKRCLLYEVQKHTTRKFNTKIADTLNLQPGVIKVFVHFTIDETGHITNVKARAPHRALELEGIRVINELPKMIPAKKNGINVVQNFALPISMYVAKSKERKKRRKQI